MAFFDPAPSFQTPSLSHTLLAQTRATFFWWRQDKVYGIKRILTHLSQDIRMTELPSGLLGIHPQEPMEGAAAVSVGTRSVFYDASSSWDSGKRTARRQLGR